MTETTYYTPKTLEEFDLAMIIEINRGASIYSRVNGFVDYEDAWVEESINSKTLKLLERWYYEKGLYRDIDLTRRVRIKNEIINE